MRMIYPITQLLSIVYKFHDGRLDTEQIKERKALKFLRYSKLLQGDVYNTHRPDLTVKKFKQDKLKLTKYVFQTWNSSLLIDQHDQLPDKGRCSLFWRKIMLILISKDLFNNLNGKSLAYKNYIYLRYTTCFLLYVYIMKGSPQSS